jgi:hypothetical protein
MGSSLRFILGFLTFVPLLNYAQAGTWVWMKGSNSDNAAANYGAMGVASATNTPPALYEAVNWIDQQGNFWIFGGTNDNIQENDDMWKYNPVNNEWTWVRGSGGGAALGVYGVQGVPSPLNQPGGRAWGALSWTDNNGNLWMYGGVGYDSTYGDGWLNDLWMYNIGNNEWTWMNGTQAYGIDSPSYGTLQVAAVTNTPGGRAECTSNWVDCNNNLWFFGGQGVIETGPGSYTGAECDDVWKYDISINQWTWMKGPAGFAQNINVYGTMGVENAANHPGARDSYTHWKDAQGYFYVWGGLNYITGSGYDDVWRYNTVTNNWTWVGGSNTANSNGNYNTYCSDNGTTGPACRWENRTPQMLGVSNTMVGFGGANQSIAASSYGMNDMWLFNTTTGHFDWVNGSSQVNNRGSYGTILVPSPTNLPPGRSGQACWMDTSGVFWMFGGLDSTLFFDYNDVWKFVPDTPCIQIAFINSTAGISYQLSANSVCNGDSVLLTITGGSNVQISPSAFAAWQDSAHVFLFPDSTTTYLLTGQSTCPGGDTVPVTIRVGAPLVNLNAATTTLCNGDSTQICAGAGYVSYHWNSGSSDSCIYANASGNYYVSVTDVNGCTAVSDTAVITSHNLGSIVLTADTPSLCTNDSVQVCAPAGFSSYVWNSGQSTQCFYADTAGSYSVLVSDNNGCTAISNTVNLNFHPIPVVTVNADTTIFCANDSTLICATSGFPTYTWNDGQTDSCRYANLAGNYYVSVTDNNGCTAISNRVAITVYPLPPTSITVNDDTFTVTSAGTVQWQKNGVNIPGATGNVFIANSLGDYTALITDSNGCTAVSAPYNYLGTANIDNDNIEVYPNPSVGSWQLVTGNNLLGSSLQIWDNEGQIIYESKIISINTQLNLNVARGLYVLRITANNKVYNFKLVRL